VTPARRLQDLNPADRPDRAPAIAPPARRAEPPPLVSSAAADVAPPKPAPPAGRPSTGHQTQKATKVMHSVPVDVLDRLKQAAVRSGRSYTDLVVGCIVDHRDHLARADAADASDAEAGLGALDRRRRHADRTPTRSAQLTLYPTAAERAELDRLAAGQGMARSQLVTAALRRGLNDLP
jgi:hypothetical protein